MVKSSSQVQKSGDGSVNTQVGNNQYNAPNGIVNVTETAERERIEFIRQVILGISIAAAAAIAFWTNPTASQHLASIGRGAFKSYRLDKEFFYENHFLYSSIYVIGDKQQKIVFSWGLFTKIFETDDYNHNQNRIGDVSKNLPATLIPPLLPGASKEDRDRRDLAILMLTLSMTFNEAFDGSDPNDPVMARQLVAKVKLASSMPGNLKPEDAIQDLTLALRLREIALGENHILVGKTLSLLARSYLEVGRYNEAEIAITRAKTILGK